ncbi:MAG: two-component sensor histidine kinase, partial [Prevotella sp.]|nr:two-component sensor histidine kinase [Prevotella sp.]
NKKERKQSEQHSTSKDNSVATHQTPAVDSQGDAYTSFEAKLLQSKPSLTPKAMILRNDSNSLSATKRNMQEIVRNRYVYQKAMLEEVVYNILYSASDKPLKQRINFKLLDQDLKAEMMNNGINIPYHFTVTTQDGREVYRCPDYVSDGEENTYSQVLFRNDPVSRMGVVKVHFPEMNNYIFSSIRFMIPSIIFTFVLLVTFIFTIVTIFRQKRYS